MRYVSSQRDRDKGVILNVVRNFGPISRVEIHRLTQIRMSTISLITKDLIAESLLTEDGFSDNPTGRKQILLKINEHEGFILGIEFDADEVTVAILNLEPRIQHLSKEPTVRDGGTLGLVDQLKSCARRTLEAAGLETSQLRGIGIADLGPVNRKAGVSVMSSQLDFWRNVPLARLMEEEFNVPVYIDNATRCRGNAERLLGAGESDDDMVYIEYGAGIGSALFAGGRPIEGHRTSSGEFGHTRVAGEDIPCKCGSFGCLEAVAGAQALAARFREIAVEGVHSSALDLVAGNRASITGWHVLEAARQGDKISSVIVEEMMRYLAMGIGNVVNLLDPARVVLDSRLAACGPEFLDQLRRAIRMQALSHITSDLVVCYGKLREEAGVLGAGLLVLEVLFAIPELKPPRYLVEQNVMDTTVR